MSRIYTGNYIEAELRPDDLTSAYFGNYDSGIKGESGMKIIFKVPLNKFNEVANWTISIYKNWGGTYTPTWETQGEYKVTTFTNFDGTSWLIADTDPWHVYFSNPVGAGSEDFYLNFDNCVDYEEPNITYHLVKFDEAITNTINIKIQGTFKNPFNNAANIFNVLTFRVYDNTNFYDYDVLQLNWLTIDNDTFTIEGQLQNPFSTTKSIGWRIEGKDVVGTALQQYMLYHNDDVLSGNPIFRIAGARRTIGVYAHLYTAGKSIWDEDNRYNAELGSYGSIFLQNKLMNMQEFENNSAYSAGAIGSSTYPFGEIYGTNIYQNGQRVITEDEFYYSPGDYTFNNIYIGGAISGSTASLMFNITTPLDLNKINSISCVSGALTIRGTAGYVESSGTSPYFSMTNTSSYTYTFEKVTRNSIIVTIKKKSGTFSNVTNNTPVNVILRNVKLRFS